MIEMTADDMDEAENDAFEAGKCVGVIQERQRCMADVCEGCRNNWDLYESGFHRDPHGTSFDCGASAIRSRNEQ